MAATTFPNSHAVVSRPFRVLKPILGDLLAEMGADGEPEPTDATVETLCDEVSGPAVQARILLELASLAHIDGHYAHV